MTVGQILAVILIVLAVFMAAGFLVPFTPLVVGLLVALGVLVCKFVP